MSKSFEEFAKLPKRPRKMKLSDIDLFFDHLSRDNPDPKTELTFKNPYTLLVAVVLSAQATDVGVNKATGPLFEAADTPEKMVALGLGQIKDYVKTIGLFNTKAQNVLKLSEILIDKYDGEVPADRAALEALPGVGRKTANVVLNEAFGQPTIAVDTHIFRVGNRTGLAPGTNPDAVEKELLRRVPEKWKKGAHHWLILHGRYVCTARKPDCTACLVSDLCLYKAKAF
ncbi:MAG: endonuclease III [Candidatus Puniceispirillaceae bacterium]